MPSIWELLSNDIGINDLKENLLGAGEIGLMAGHNLASLGEQGFNTLMSTGRRSVADTIAANEAIAAKERYQYHPTQDRTMEMAQNMSETLAPVTEAEAGVRQWMGDKEFNSPFWKMFPDEVRAGAGAVGSILPEIGESLLGLRTARSILGAGDIASAYKPGRRKEAGATGGYGDAVDGDIKANERRVQPKNQSLADATAEGWKHPLGTGKNLKIHKDDMSYEIDDTGDLLDSVKRTPDELLGMTGIYTAGDRSRTGGNLLSVNDEVLPNPVRMEGGKDYARDKSHPYAWASKDTTMSNLENTVQGAKGRGSQPVGVFSPMEFKSLDFNTMTNDTALGLMQRDLSPSSKKAFDVEMRKTIKQLQNQSQPVLKGFKWKGLDDPSSLKMLDELGDLRHAFMGTVKKEKTQSMKGAPDLPSIRHAVTSPDLMDFEGDKVGQGLSLLEGGLVKDAADGHSTYNTSMYGSSFGELENPASVKDVFPSFFEHRRLVGGDPSADPRSLDLKKPWQLFDRETIQGMKGEPLDRIEASATGEKTPFGGGGHLQDLHKQQYPVKKQYTDDLGDFNPYKAAGFDVDESHQGIGAWSEGGETQYNPVTVEKPIFDNDMGLPESMEKANAVEHYKGLVNVQAGSPYNIQQRVPADEANALRFNFRQEPSMKDIENMSLLGADNDRFLSPSGYGRYSLLGGNPTEAIENAGETAIKAVGNNLKGDAKVKGFLTGNQSAIVEPVRSSGDYIDLEGQLTTRGKGKATQAALDSWDKVMPTIERLMDSPDQKAYIKNKMIVDARYAKETGDVTREDYNTLYSILSDPDLSGADIIKKLKEGVKNGGLPAAGFLQLDDDEQ